MGRSARLAFAQGDKLYSVEKVIGSAFNDYLYGLDGFAETMIGGADASKLLTRL